MKKYLILIIALLFAACATGPSLQDRMKSAEVTAADQKLTALTPLGEAPASGDLTYLVDITGNTSHSITVANLMAYASNYRSGGTDVAVADGGTGASTAAAAFTALKQAATTTATGTAELATTAETTTGTDAARIVTPDGLSGSIYGQKEIGWTVYDSDVATEIADGKQSAVIPASMNGMNLIDVACSVAGLNSASGGTTTVVLRRVRGATAVDMTSTGVTIDYNAYTASDETVNTSNDDVTTGDKIYVDVNAVTSGAAQLGLSCTAVFQTP